MKYNDKIMQMVEKNERVGSFADTENIGTGLVGAPSCGDVLKLQIKVENGTIVDSRVLIFGCVAAKAASVYAAEKVIGKTLKEATQITDEEIAHDLGMPKIKLHCSVLAHEAINAAISDYKNMKVDSIDELNIKASKEASEFIQGVLKKTEHDSVGIRIDLSEVGCGMSYKIKEMTDADITKNDLSCEIHGLKIFVDKKIVSVINNLKMELTHRDGQTGITFIDENGCGRCAGCNGSCGKNL